MAVNHSYLANHATTPCVFTLPATAAVGDIIEVIGEAGSGGWSIAQNALQKIVLGNKVSATGTGGSLANGTDSVTDNVTLKCTVADTEFTVMTAVGNLNITVA
jgi:hypothetical protein